MIPYPYNMVDMGGIDLAEANGTIVDGLYAKIVEAVNACGDIVLYNWKFAGIEIAPQHTSILLGDSIIINGSIQVTEQDEVIVPGINPEPPPPPVIIPLSVAENGTFSADDYEADGFDPVTVTIPAPILEPLEVDSNGSYSPPSGVVGFSTVLVNVSGVGNPIVVSITGGYNGGAELSVMYQNAEIFSAVGSSPYNINYTPNSYSGQIGTHTIVISVPALRNDTSFFAISITWDGIEYIVSFRHTGANTSYGYGSQQISILP